MNEALLQLLKITAPIVLGLVKKHFEQTGTILTEEEVFAKLAADSAEVISEIDAQLAVIAARQAVTE